MKWMHNTKLAGGLLSLLLCFNFVSAYAKTGSYGRSYCKTSGFSCVRIKKGDSWEKLFPSEEEQQLVKKINRLNINLQPGMVLAVPNDLNGGHMRYAPFPSHIDTSSNNLVMINLRDQAFAAYDELGNLVNWGPVSGGNAWCPDVGRSCLTPTGSFRVISKGGPGCISSKYPIPFGGAPMPYCMYFYGGYAMHASTLPGYNASHGCVRMLYEDAYWMNTSFVNTGKNATKVIITR